MRILATWLAKCNQPCNSFFQKSTLVDITFVLTPAPSWLVAHQAHAGDEQSKSLVTLGWAAGGGAQAQRSRAPLAAVKMHLVSLLTPYILSLHINTVYPVQGTYRQNQRKTTTILGTGVILSPPLPQCSRGQVNAKRQR